MFVGNRPSDICPFANGARRNEKTDVFFLKKNEGSHMFFRKSHEHIYFIWKLTTFTS